MNVRFSRPVETEYEKGNTVKIRDGRAAVCVRCVKRHKSPRQRPTVHNWMGRGREVGYESENLA